MKQNRFLGTILAGFIFFIVSYSPAIVAMEDAFEMVGEDIAVDAEGNVLKDVTEDEIKTLNEAIEKGEIQTLDDLKAQLPQANLLSKEDSEVFLKGNEDAAQAVNDLKNEKLSIADKTAKQADIDNLEGFNRAKNTVGKIDKAVDSSLQRATSDMKKLAEDLKKVPPMKLIDLRAKWLPRVALMPEATLTKLSTMLGDPSVLTIKTDMEAAVKAGKGDLVEKLCVKITKLKAMEGLVDQITSLEKDAANGIAGYEGQLQKTLEDSVENLNNSFKKFEDDPKALLKDEPIKDAEGKQIMQSAAEKFSSDIKSTVGDVVKKDLKGFTDEIDGQADALSSKMGLKGRFEASIFVDKDPLGRAGAAFKKSIASVTRDDIAESFSSVGRSIKGLGKSALELVGEGAKMLISGVMFMIPNIFQASFLAQKQRQVQLQTLANPIKYGDWVFQIPDSCFNFDNPEATLPIYVRIPVTNVDQAVSAAALKAYNNSVKGPSTNNAVSSAIHSVGATISSFGGDLSARPKRYNLKEAEYLAYNPGIILAYFAPGGYQSWGSVPLTSSQFTSGQIIDITTGVIIDGSGERISATGMNGFDAYPLSKVTDFHAQQAPSLQPLSIKDFLPTIESKIDLSGDVVKYIEYDTVTAGSSMTTGSDSLKGLFNCDCLDATSSATCGSTGSCLINRSLKQYELGLSMNADGSAGLGTLLTSPATTPVSSAPLPSQKTLTQNVKALVAAGTANSVVTSGGNKKPILGRLSQTPAAVTANPNYLGSVVPLYGWGSGSMFSELINQTTFANHATLNLASLVSQTVVKGAADTAAQETPNFADDTQNYGAQGCWVYLSSQTPFAKAVQAGSSDRSVYGPYVDYIIFLNAAGIQVPLMVAIEQKDATDSYTSTTIGLNKHVKYWTSLAAFDNTTFTALPQNQGPSGNPLKYDLLGNAYEDPALAGKTGVIATAIADLAANFGSGDTNLSAQFVTHQQVMVDKINNGPFNYGNVSLMLSNYNLQVPGSGAGAQPQAEIVMYQGSKCFGSSVDDLLVPFDSVAGNTASLPDANATIFYSVITDITYTVVNGALVPCLNQATCPANSYMNPPLLAGSGAQPTYSLSLAGSVSDITTYNVLYGTLESSLVQNYPLASGVTSYISPELQVYVIAQRKAWASQFDKSAQKQGITVGNLTCSLPAEFKTNLTLSNKAFIYEIAPMPSAAFCDNDLFALVSSAQPALSNLKPINAQFADNKTIAVSLMTGFLFDMTGAQLMHANGTPRRLDTAGISSATTIGTSNKVQSLAGMLYDQITGMFPLATIATPAFVEKYKAWVASYEAQMHRPMGPYSFGPLRVGIFAGDFAIGNYVYFDAKDMHKPDFEPEDIYMTFDGTKLGAVLDSSTAYLVSLVSGNAYQPDGSVFGRLPAAQLLSQTQALQLQWGMWLKGIVNKLQKAMADRIAAQSTEQATLDALITQLATQHEIETDFMTPGSVQNIIQSLQPGGVQGLPAPYGLLQRDPVRNIYVNVSPASGSDADNLLYFFFYIGTDKATKKQIGGIFTAAGNIDRVVKGIELQIMRDQYGVVVSEDGSVQKLGIPLTQPSFAMTQPDEKITWGSDSSDNDLISSMSPYFPGGTVQMSPGLWLYYSSTMGTYYVYEVAKERWIDVSARYIYTEKGGKWSVGIGGNLYAQDGASIPLEQKVAFVSSSKKTITGIAVADDMILLYQNQNGQMQGYMSDGQNYVNLQQNNNVMSWTSLTSSSSLTVTESANKDSYTVKGATTSKNYNVSKTAAWYSLFAVPIDDTGALLKTRISSSYKNAALVIDGNKKPTHMLYNGDMYKVAGSSVASYTMVPVDASNTGSITVSFAVDDDTTAPYVTVVDGADSYKYLYVMDSLDADDQDFYQARIKGVSTVATRAFPVGPLLTKTKTVGATSITASVPELSTHVLFARNIPKTATNSLILNPVASTSVIGVPSKGQGLTEFKKSSAAFYANLAMVLQSSDGRFFVNIAPYSATAQGGVLNFSYVTNGAYVDLQTGVLYDSTNGVCLGYCLILDDWLSVLNKVCVDVITKAQVAAGALQGVKSTQTITLSKSELALAYRSPQAIKVQTAALVVDENAVTRLEDFATAARVKPVATLGG